MTAENIKEDIPEDVLADWELVKAALDDEEKRQELRNQVAGLVEDIADRYANIDTNKTGMAGWKNNIKKKMSSLLGKSVFTKKDLTKVGWKHFDSAVKNYHKTIKERVDENQDVFKFSTYFSWYIRKSIRTHLGIDSDEDTIEDKK